MDMPTLYYEHQCYEHQCREHQVHEHQPMCNRLWAAIPAPVRNRLLPFLERVPLPLGKELYVAGQKLRYVYFPTHGVVSLMYAMNQGGELQIATVGEEGVIGVAALIDGAHTNMRTIVQSAGSAYRLLSSVLEEELRNNRELQLMILHYFHRLLSQVAQIALCNRYHTIEQQLCRCLLLSSEPSPEKSIKLTQELIASLLGVRREGVTLAAGKLQQSSIISYHRGHIKILDRPKLEQLACECYAALKKINHH